MCLKNFFILFFFMSCILLSTRVASQHTCELSFSVLTKDSTSISELILDGRRFSFFKKRELTSSDTDTVKYHDYDISLIADYRTIFENNNIIPQDSFTSRPHIGYEIYPSGFMITLGVGGVPIRSFKIDVYHDKDTMSVEILNIDRICNMRLGSVFFKPGYYVLDLDTILIQRYDGEMKKSKVRGNRLYFYTDEDKRPLGGWYNIAPFEWIDKREEAKSNEETEED